MEDYTKNMTIMPMWKRCHRCGRIYDWNPDVGIRSCPSCMKKDIERLQKIRNMFTRKPQDDTKKV